MTPSLLQGVRRALVVAPHPDDESLGAGGLIALASRGGAELLVVFVTDGGASHLKSPSWPRPRLAARRRQEAEAALAALGAQAAQRLFLDLPDAAMPAPGSPDHERALVLLAQAAGAFRPDLAVLPWRRDPHRDHRDAHALALAALARCNRRPRILEYAVWLDESSAPGDRPSPGEAVPHRLDIASVAAEKRAAVAAHESQTTRLIADDPDGFMLSPATIGRLVTAEEVFWETAP